MTESISKEFNFKELMIFAFPSIVMMVFLSLYTIVDGFFVSHFVGTEALSAVNITYPLTSIIVAIGIMFATGGSSIVAKQIGQGSVKVAKKSFSMICLTAIIISAIVSAISIVHIDNIVNFMGANGNITFLCKDYLTVLLLFAPMSVLQMLFQSFLITAGKPNLGLILTIVGGLSNMILDYVFIVILNIGVLGAAYATAFGYCVPAVGGLIFFFSNRKGLCFSKFKISAKTVIECCINGSSEMVTNLSVSITTLLFNVLMMNFAGVNGVASITVVLYTQFLMTAFFMGFSIGVAPIVSYHYGSQNKAYLMHLIHICMVFILVASVIICAFSLLSSNLISGLFSHDNFEMLDLTTRGLRIFSISFLFAGINIFASALFTALSDGKTSALISFSRTLLFTVIGILGLSYFWGTDGLWLSIPFAELITTIFVLIFSRKISKNYL